MQNLCGYKSHDYFKKVILRPLIDSEKVILTIPERPKSPKQQYVWNNVKN